MEKIKIWRKDGFRLTMYDTGRRDGRGQTVIAYRFCDRGRLIFEGDDFACSPMHADDSRESVMALLGFLSLRPGDTDAEYFAKYTREQREWAESSRAESLSLIVYDFEESRQGGRHG